ncbi:hypothetical protein BC826DRAFT_972508 [Russula brevipes]|nr:hypothetical protein BC826DRAFT_972508 [Russula brevipes]
MRPTWVRLGRFPGPSQATRKVPCSLRGAVSRSKEVTLEGKEVWQDGRQTFFWGHEINNAISRDLNVPTLANVKADQMGLGVEHHASWTIQRAGDLLEQWSVPKLSAVRSVRAMWVRRIGDVERVLQRVEAKFRSPPTWGSLRQCVIIEEVLGEGRRRSGSEGSGAWYPYVVIIPAQQ